MLYEIAVRDIPYGDEIAQFKKKKRAGMGKKFMREVAQGYRQPTLDGRVECTKYRVGLAFKKRELSCGDKGVANQGRRTLRPRVKSLM